ncbi:MAG: antitoxin Xre/MbcA/ParS toxin-binding domain-containing protein [Thermodesulfobacteriota bacterium]
MIRAAAIADVLGIKDKVRSLRDLQAEVERGLPKASLQRCVTLIISDPKEQKKIIYRIVPSATYHRRKRILKIEESEKTERLARVIATANHVWNDEEDARRFLTSPHPMLGMKTPIEVSHTELGARRIEEMLWNLFHGLPA